MHARISSQLKHFSIHIFPHATHLVIKGEALRLLRTNSSKALFEEMFKNFKRNDNATIHNDETS